MVGYCAFHCPECDTFFVPKGYDMLIPKMQMEITRLQAVIESLRDEIDDAVFMEK